MTSRSLGLACPTCATPLRDLRGGRRDYFCTACHATVSRLDDGELLIAHWDQPPKGPQTGPEGPELLRVPSPAVETSPRQV